MPEHPEVLTMGRIGVDIYPLQTGVGLAEVQTFQKFLGGSASNVAVAAARLGRRSAVITKVGEDPFGRYLTDALADFGVCNSFVGTDSSLPTPVTFCEIFPPDDFPIYFYRNPSAPDLQLRGSELDLDAVRGCAVFWVTGTGLCQSPSREATLAALGARDRRGITVLDIDYRPAFWASRDQARTAIAQALPLVDVVVGNRDECLTAVGLSEPAAAAAALRESGVRLAVVKSGPDGVLGVDDDGAVAVPPHAVEVVNGLGAGDAFGGALCHGMLAGWPLRQILVYANAAGAIVASRLACSAAMPTAAEIESIMGGRADDRAVRD